MEIKFKGIWKSKDSLESSFQDYKQQTIESASRIEVMEKHLKEMDEAMKHFEESKDLFGKQLVKNVDEIRGDIDQLKDRQEKDTRNFARIEEKQSDQDAHIANLQRQLDQFRVFMLKVNNNQTKKSEELEKRVETLESSREVSKGKFRKRWSLPLSYQLQVFADSDQLPSASIMNPPSVPGQKHLRRNSSRSLKGKKNLSASHLDISSKDSSPTSRNCNTLPRRKYHKSPTFISDSIHTKKILATSTPDVTPIDREHNMEESGYLSPSYNYALHETSGKNEKGEQNVSFLFRIKPKKAK